MLVNLLNTKNEEKYFRNLMEEGFIRNFKILYSQDKKFEYFHFQLEKFCFDIEGEKISIDLSGYKIKIQYSKGQLPFAFCKNINFTKSTPHIYHKYRNALCLYKIGTVNWLEKQPFAEYLFPWICTWLYFYEKWKETGIWYGEEAPH